MISRLANLILAACVGLSLLFAVTNASSAEASFGLEKFDVTYTKADGSPTAQAGSHPFAMTTTVYFNTLAPEHPDFTDGEFKGGAFEQIAGLIGDPAAVPRCSTVDFLTFTFNGPVSNCPDATAVGYAATKLSVRNFAPIYNLVPPPGVVSKLGFIAYNTPITIEVGVKDRFPYNVRAVVTNTPQSDPNGILASVLTLWGNPADPAHDPLRGICVSTPNQVTPTPEFPEPISHGKCPTNVPSRPFLTLPRACEGPLASSYAINSWLSPGALLSNGEPDLADPSWVHGSVLTHDDAVPPNPIGITGCSKLGFSPSITAQPTTKAAQSPTGLDFSLDVHDEGLTSPSGLANSDIKKAVVTLPEGFTTNPSLAEGLAVCSEADLARETAKSASGAGCPNASKIGSVEVETPLLEETLRGSLFIAKPYENEFGSLLALYIVIKSEKLGIVVRQAAEVTPDPLTGQLVTTTEDMPQLPFSHFRLHLREGTRSPLASPPGCGTYNASAELTPWAGGAPTTTTSAFQIIVGPESGPCPSGGMPPFKPGLIAGTLNNAAGHFSPFNLRLFRSDSEQEITHFSIKLPPGIVGKLAGIPYCSDAAIAAAKARTGPYGGQEEIESPSCPAASEIGRTLAGAGVGPSLAYAPGKVYLAGPYHGSNLSMVAITAGVVGPFDIGTVVVREAFKIDPETAEVFVDSTGSDPIPHIIKGIPVHLRDIRAYIDRPDFVLNPTDCTKTSTASTLLGSGLDFGSEADDRPVTVSTPFQAADCAALPFKPQLGLRLIGKTNRGAHPAFRANLKMNGIGEAGIARAQVTLPHSEFIENAHFKTICTRVQFKAGAGNGASCPAGSIYGHAKAVTPILGEPLEGPVFLRSSEHQLPDLVVALHNAQVDFDLVGKVDSVKGGEIRNTFEAAPDAPVSSFMLEMEGGKKGLFVNSTDLCKRTHRAEAAFTGQNGKVSNSKPALKVKCGGKGKKAKHRKRAAHRRRASLG
jgi:hypothetical protein